MVAVTAVKVATAISSVEVTAARTSSVAATAARISSVAAMAARTSLVAATATAAMAAAKVRVVMTRYERMKLIEIENLDAQIFFN